MCWIRTCTTPVPDLDSFPVVFRLCGQPYGHILTSTLRNIYDPFSQEQNCSSPRMLPEAPGHSVGCYFGLFHTITRLSHFPDNPCCGLSRNSTVKHPTERKRFWLLTQRLNVLAAFRTQRFSQNAYHKMVTFVKTKKL